MSRSHSDSGEDWNPYAPPTSSFGLASSPTLTWWVAISVFIPIVVFVAFAVVWFVAGLSALSPFEQKILGYPALFYLVLRFSLCALNKGRVPVRELAIGMVVGLLIYWL